MVERVLLLSEHAQRIMVRRHRVEGRACQRVEQLLADLLGQTDDRRSLNTLLTLECERLERVGTLRTVGTIVTVRSHPVK